MIKRRYNKINLNNIGLHQHCTEQMEKMHQKLVLKENEVVEHMTDNDELLKQIEELKQEKELLIKEKENWIAKDAYMYNFLEDNNFKQPNDLFNFIIKWKKHKCICKCLPITNIYENKDQSVIDKNESHVNITIPNIPLHTSKIDENINKFESLNNINRKYWKEYEYSIIKFEDYIINDYDYYYIKKYKDYKINTPKKRKKKVITDQQGIIGKVINKIKKNIETIKKKDNNIYDLLYNKNRKDIDLYSYLYLNNSSIEIVKEIDIKIDTNKSRFNLITNIFNKIKNTPILYNSEYIFNYYTFKEINNTGLNDLIDNLNILCNKNTPNNEQDELLFECKNPSCIDTINEEDTFCDDCKKSLINCKKCKEEFYTDENITVCEECDDYY